MKYCINCGKVIPDVAKFCGVCGTKQEITDDQKPSVANYNNRDNNDKKDNTSINSKTKKCPFCAETINEAASVCRYCHKKLNNRKTLNANKVCIILSLIIELVMLCIMFVPFINVSYDIQFGSGSIVDIDVFTGFEAVEEIKKIEAVVGQIDNNISSVCFVMSLIATSVITLGIALYIHYFYKFNVFFMAAPDWDMHTCYPIAPAIFVIMVLIFKNKTSEFLSENHLDLIELSLSSSVIILIVLIFVQIIINMRPRNKEETEVYLPSDKKEWKCEKCGIYNNWNAVYCAACDSKREHPITKVTKWQCKHCGTYNGLDSQYCKFCEQKKPKSSEKNENISRP